MSKVINVCGFKHQRCKNSQDMRVGTGTCEYVVLQQGITNFSRWPIADESEQQAHALDFLYGSDDALFTNLCFSFTDIR